MRTALQSNFKIFVWKTLSKVRYALSSSKGLHRNVSGNVIYGFLVKWYLT